MDLVQEELKPLFLPKTIAAVSTEKMESPVLSGLDAALHELGMLSTVTESRCEYLREKAAAKLIAQQQLAALQAVEQLAAEQLVALQAAQQQAAQPRQALNVLHMNTRFITGMVIGQRKARMLRYRPYNKREKRTRTKSENSDVDLDKLCNSDFTPVAAENSELYRSRSLENIKVTETNDPVLDVESVSCKIGRLQVSE